MKLTIICLVLVFCIASTEVEAFRFARFGQNFKKIIRDGVRFLFGRRDRNQPVENVVIGQNPEVLRPVVAEDDVPAIMPGMMTKAPIKPTKPSPMKRTIIAIKQETSYGQYLYLRGGGPEGKPIKINHRIAPEDQTSFFASTSKGDNYLDWGSNEQSQGRYEDRLTPQGTPMMWTTNDEEYHSNVGQDGAGYYDLNIQSGHYWLVDLDMNCSQTTDGWFEFKGYLTWDGQLPKGSGWEKNFPREPCMTKDGPATFQKADPIANNHIGRCGEFNLVHFEEGTCYIHSLNDVEQWSEDFHGENPTVVE